MAKLTAMPSLAIIKGLAGTIDYYYWRGIPVARTWPKSPGKKRSPAVMAQWEPFREASQLWRQMTPRAQEHFHKWAGHGRMNGRDLQIKCYMGTIYRNPLP